jgi:PIN domain nuclease of toxin-antitoxin system
MDRPDEIPRRVLATIRGASQTSGILISAISIWEIGMLEAKVRLRLSMDASVWVERALSAPGVHIIPIGPDVAIESCRLPGARPADPADRLLIATARLTGAGLVTRDRHIVNYAGMVSGLVVVDATP